MTAPRDTGAPLGLIQVVRDPGARNYLLIGCAALIVYCTVMFDRAGEMGSLVALALAIPGLTVRWVISPILFLVLTTYLVYDPNFTELITRTEGYGAWSMRRRPAELELRDLVLAGSVLIYLMAQFRLLSLMHKSMPDDPSPRRKGQPEPKPPRRPLELVSNRELGVMLQLTPVYVLAGVLAWFTLSQYESVAFVGRSWGIETPFARLILFLGPFIGSGLLIGVYFRYVALRRMSRTEARLMLQDMFWRETRREHERIFRWRHWFKKHASNSSTGNRR
jgi:hypothetical protein